MDCPSGPARILESETYGSLVLVGNDAGQTDAILSVLNAPPAPQLLRERVASLSVTRAAARDLGACSESQTNSKISREVSKRKRQRKSRPLARLTGDRYL